MVNARQRNNDDTITDRETYVTVQDLRKEYQSASCIGGSERAHINDDDRSCVSMSVKERLKRFQSTKMIDARQDDDPEESENNERAGNGDETYANVMDRYREFQLRRGRTSSTRDASSVVCSSTSVFGPVANQTVNEHNRPRLVVTTPINRSVTTSSPLSTDQNCSPPLTVSFHTREADFSKNDGFQYGNVALKKVEKPVEDRWKRNLAKDSAKEQLDDDDQSCLMSLVPGVPYTRKDDETNSLSIRRMSLPAAKAASSKPLHTISSSPHARNSFSNMATSPRKCTKPKSLTHRSTSLPTHCYNSTSLINSSPATEMKPKEITFNSKTESPISADQKFQNDLAAALKKVGRPIEERWKLIKNCDENVADTSKPVFANMKLKSIGSTANATPTESSRVSEARQYFDDQSTICNRKSFSQNLETEDVQEEGVSPSKRQQKFVVPTKIDTSQTTSNICDEDHDRPYLVSGSPRKELKRGMSVSDLAKNFSAKTEHDDLDDENSPRSGRKRQFVVPAKIDTSHTSKIEYGDHDKLKSVSGTPHKDLKRGMSVSDLAKNFAARTVVKSPTEESDDDKASSEPNEIEKIRNSLRSTAKDQGTRNFLNMSSPVAKLIAEKNKAAKTYATKDLKDLKMSSTPVAKLISEKNKALEASGCCVENLRKKFAQSGEGLSNGGRSYKQSNTNSTSQRLIVDEDCWVRNPLSPCSSGQPCDPGNEQVENKLEREVPEDHSNSNSWENPETDEIFPLSFLSTVDKDDEKTFFSNFGKESMIESELMDNANQDLVPTDQDLLQSYSSISDNTTDSEGNWLMYGESRYIQFTLSTGGITELVEPNININMAPSVPSPSMGSQSDVSSKKDKKKGLVEPLKGAKKFFFGKNKRKMTEEDPYTF
mmetsp:Transcript_18198/g.50678  ORF Transcript_18198/g.50678 Transcript_18198/m.50678 type:complete len:886 (-) Transcript_18198:3057-5714(-)